MKHINESIIGRKDSNRVPPLANLDIVEIRDGGFYIVFLDKDDFHSVNDKLKWKNPGILYSQISSSFYDINFLWLKDYTGTLEYSLDGYGYRNPECDIMNIWRPKNPNIIPEYFDIKYLNWLVENSLGYTQIFER